MTDAKIRAIVVDDSALMRQLLTKALTSDDTIDVVAVAVDAFDARDKIKKYNPDVITLDIEMPNMDGLSFLERIMRLHPMPVVMISTPDWRRCIAVVCRIVRGLTLFVATEGTGSSPSAGRPGKGVDDTKA